MTVRSYAKINLGLRILRKRPDGYHDLETVFHRIHLFDEIDLLPTEGPLTLETDLTEIPTDSTNLCLRAAQLLKDRARTRSGAAMTLRKRIPVGAGLGGGSSNAAAVLLALKDLWSVRVEREELQTMALSLGSDVPYFLTKGSALATGRGDHLEAIQLNLPYWIVVVVPPVHVSTAWAYKNLTLQDHRGEVSLGDHLQQTTTDHEKLLPALTNDFEPLVLSSYPIVLDSKQQLSRSGARHALLSGSGSAVFGLFPTEEAAREAMEGFSSDQFVVSLTGPEFSPPVPHIVRD
jgi:4-diphosphocytidyl-2-C-methyl-D-erythritol kinase